MYIGCIFVKTHKKSLAYVAANYGFNIVGTQEPYQLQLDDLDRYRDPGVLI